jgi:hypothetical protein
MGLSRKARPPQWARVGVGASGISDRFALSGNAYLLQGIATAVPQSQRQELDQIAIHSFIHHRPRLSVASFGGLGRCPRAWQLNPRAAAQVAFQPLRSSMQFSLGPGLGL